MSAQSSGLEFNNLLNNPPSVERPFVCMLKEFISYDEDNEHTICMLEDGKGNTIIGFFYKKFAKLLKEPKIKNRIPFKISIVKGSVNELGKNLIFEIYQVIFEPNSLINSSQMSAHSYCPMGTYFRTHLKVEGDLNSNLLFGVLLHDYLSFIFMDSEVTQMKPNNPLISVKVLTYYQQAIYRNWELISACGLDDKVIFQTFKENYLVNEVDFVNYELEKFSQNEDIYQFETEVSLRSKAWGFQGRIDRLLWNKTKGQFTIYETKTGKSSASVESSAQYQLITYALMLREYYQKELEELILEYPRYPVNSRLKIIDYDESVLPKIIDMRNEIWAISIGYRPNNGPFMHCGNCWSKDVCSFYCLRNYAANYCISCGNCKYHDILDNDNQFKEFRRANTYFDWFNQFLDAEYLYNFNKLSQLNLPAVEREKLGDCLANLVIESIQNQIEILNIAVKSDAPSSISTSDDNDDKVTIVEENELSPTSVITLGRAKLEGQSNDAKTEREDMFAGTRFNIGDYVIMTPLEYRPLTLQSYSGYVKNIFHEKIEITTDSSNVEKLKAFHPATLFRVDSITSNQVLDMEKSVLDKILRKPYTTDDNNLSKVRRLLMNMQGMNELPQRDSAISLDLEDIKSKLISMGLNEDQYQAVLKAVQFQGILLIHGPPGTGKTTTIAEIIYHLNKSLDYEGSIAEAVNSSLSEVKSEKKGKIDKKSKKNTESPDFEIQMKKFRKKILISAYTNKAVDTIIEKVHHSHPELKIIRIGTTNSTIKANIPLLLQNQNLKIETFVDGSNLQVNSPNKTQEVIQNADIIAATCLGCANVVLSNYEFDYVIIDEAGQVVEPAALIPLVKGNNIILVGDDQQLPPISQDVQKPSFDPIFFEQCGYLKEGKRGKEEDLKIDTQRNSGDFNNDLFKFGVTSADEIQIKNKNDLFFQELEAMGIGKDDSLSTSIFQRLKRLYSKSSNFISLKEQYRMNELICSFISQHFYDNTLKPGVIKGVKIGKRRLEDYFNKMGLDFYKLKPSIDILTGTHVKPKKELPPSDLEIVFSSDKPVIFLDTHDINAIDSSMQEQFTDIASKFNEKEARIVSNIIYSFFLQILNSMEPSKPNEFYKDLVRNIGIISPYRAQIRTIRNLITAQLNTIPLKTEIRKIIDNNLVTDTVDKFQGQEAEIIIISLVDSNDTSKLGELYNEVRRLNVSITRAKTKLILIGNSSMFTSPPLKIASPQSDTIVIRKRSASLMNYMNESPMRGHTESLFEYHNDTSRKRPIEVVLGAFVKYCIQNQGYIRL